MVQQSVEFFNIWVTHPSSKLSNFTFTSRSMEFWCGWHMFLSLLTCHSSRKNFYSALFCEKFYRHCKGSHQQPNVWASRHRFLWHHREPRHSQNKSAHNNYNDLAKLIIAQSQSIRIGFATLVIAKSAQQTLLGFSQAHHGERHTANATDAPLAFLSNFETTVEQNNDQRLQAPCLAVTVLGSPPRSWSSRGRSVVVRADDVCCF